MLKTYSIPMAKCSTPFHSSRSKLAILEASKLAEYSSKSNSPLVPVVVFVVRDQGDCGKRIELNPFKSLPDVRFNQLHPSYSPPDVQCKQLHPSYYYVPDFNATSCIPPITMYQIPMQPAASLPSVPDVLCDQLMHWLCILIIYLVKNRLIPYEFTCQSVDFKYSAYS